MTQQLSEPVGLGQWCFVNCGRTGEDCACYRNQMAMVFQSLASKQTRLGADFEKAWSENVEELYEP